MRRLLFVFTLTGLFLSCTQDKETNDSVVLTLPFGKYYNWVNWEMKQINFRVRDNELLIDTTYDLNVHDFKTHHFERLEDYPEIANFLKKPVTELHDLQNAMNKISCENRHQFWIRYDDGTKLTLIKFRGTNDCDPTQRGTLASVYQEMEKLKDKYKP
jgi:DNA-directed RNA polymerase specialized sigma subunit